MQRYLSCLARNWQTTFFLSFSWESKDDFIHKTELYFGRRSVMGYSFFFFLFFTVLKFLKSCRIIIFSKVVLEF